MTDLSRDPLQNAIYNGLRRDIELLIEEGRWRSVLILIYSGIDVMAWLDMPPTQQDVKAADFIAWCNKYIRFPCAEQLTGEDLYGARCSVLHSHTMESRKSREGKCRRIGYVDNALPEVRCDPNSSTVFVAIVALKEAFFAGIDRFLVSAYSDNVKAPLVESRVSKFFVEFPFTPSR